MKRRIQKKRESGIIKKYEPVFENMFEPMVELINQFKPTEYRTYEINVKAVIEKKLDDTKTATESLEAFVKLFRSIDVKSGIHELKKKTNKEVVEYTKDDKRFPVLLRLVNEVEKKHPNSPCVLLFKINPLELLSKIFEPYDLILSQKSKTGEEAARNAVRIFREIAELLYNDYLRALYSFVQILEGKSEISLTNRFGTLAKQLPERLEKLGFANLVDADAGWIRNATCHAHYFYKPEIGQIVLWDERKPQKYYSTDELFEKAFAMYSMVAKNYLSVSFIYFVNKLCSKEWGAILKYIQINWDSLMNGDEKKLAHIEKMFKNELKFLSKLKFQ